eukprot:TRINITY_DN32564_c0_g1_i1.p1 TRINITY_DN32564_c0_g1~~TRINITY_DN32564_c0_g1_i1.p1  ORF type:complete len:510 (-),score=98.96 TRINITY_DN32564_c0_g1_i1:69-1598(-)
MGLSDDGASSEQSHAGPDVPLSPSSDADDDTEATLLGRLGLGWTLHKQTELPSDSPIATMPQAGSKLANHGSHCSSSAIQWDGRDMQHNFQVTPWDVTHDIVSPEVTPWEPRWDMTPDSWHDPGPWYPSQYGEGHEHLLWYALPSHPPHEAQPPCMWPGPCQLWPTQIPQQWHGDSALAPFSLPLPPSSDQLIESLSAGPHDGSKPSIEIQEGEDTDGSASNKNSMQDGKHISSLETHESAEDSDAALEKEVQSTSRVELQQMLLQSMASIHCESFEQRWAHQWADLDCDSSAEAADNSDPSAEVAFEAVGDCTAQAAEVSSRVIPAVPDRVSATDDPIDSSLFFTPRSADSEEISKLTEPQKAARRHQKAKKPKTSNHERSVPKRAAKIESKQEVDAGSSSSSSYVKQVLRALCSTSLFSRSGKEEGKKSTKPASKAQGKTKTRKLDRQNASSCNAFRTFDPFAALAVLSCRPRLTALALAALAVYSGRAWSTRESERTMVVHIRRNW